MLQNKLFVKCVYSILWLTVIVMYLPVTCSHFSLKFWHTLTLLFLSWSITCIYYPVYFIRLDATTTRSQPKNSRAGWESPYWSYCVSWTIEWFLPALPETRAGLGVARLRPSFCPSFFLSVGTLHWASFDRSWLNWYTV